jgi:hypothetical protein
VLNKPEFNDTVFAAFLTELKDIAPPAILELDDLQRHVRLCWTAHLVADYACAYWHVATGKPQGLKYKCMNPDDKATMGNVVNDVGRAIL